MDLDEAILQHTEVGEPNLTYWNPNPSPVAHIPPKFDAYHLSEQLNGTIYPQNSGSEYPLPDIVHSFVQDQQVRLNGPALSYGSFEGTRRMRRPPQLNPEGLLSAISGHSGQPTQAMMNDGAIHDEVTRAAKTLFSKRNRTLLHWLNPGVSKSQLKIDVDAAWQSLPAAEKVFYISQVLGKFAPHTTSLMVNPQLSGESITLVEPAESGVDHTVNYKSNAGCSSSNNHRCTCKRQPRKKYERTKKIKVEPVSDDDANGSSELVANAGPKKVECQEQTKPKRKYKKRKSEHNDIGTKAENALFHTSEETEKMVIKTEKDEKPIVPPIKINLKEAKKVTIDSSLTPKAKRKYIKRKLERKKYTRREKIPKEVSKPQEERLLTATEDPILSQTSGQASNSLDDMDVFIELDENALFEGVEPLQLLNEDIDSFWDNIEDPESFFDELDINEMYSLTTEIN